MTVSQAADHDGIDSSDCNHPEYEDFEVASADGTWGCEVEATCVDCGMVLTTDATRADFRPVGE